MSKTLSFTFKHRVTHASFRILSGDTKTLFPLRRWRKDRSFYPTEWVRGENRRTLKEYPVTFTSRMLEVKFWIEMLSAVALGDVYITFFSKRQKRDANAQKNI